MGLLDKIKSGVDSLIDKIEEKTGLDLPEFYEENKSPTTTTTNNVGSTSNKFGYTSITGEQVTFNMQQSSNSQTSTVSYSSTNNRNKPKPKTSTTSSNNNYGYTSTSGQTVTLDIPSTSTTSQSNKSNQSYTPISVNNNNNQYGYTSVTGEQVTFDIPSSSSNSSSITTEYTFVSYSSSSSKRYRPIGGYTDISGKEVYIYEEMGKKPKEIVDKYISTGIGEAIITSIPIVGQIWHAYETKKATEELEKYLKEHPEEAEYVYKELERLRKEKLKQLLGDTAFHGAMILVPSIAGARLGIVAGKIAGSPLTKTALQGALIGGVTGFIGETGRQTVNKAFGDNFNVNQVLLSTGIGAGMGALLGAGLYKFATKTGRYHLVSDKSVVKDINIEKIRVKRLPSKQQQLTYSASGKANIEYYIQTRKGLQPIGTKTEPYYFHGKSYVVDANRISQDIIQNADDNVLQLLQSNNRIKQLIKTEGTGYIGKQRFEAEFYGINKGYRTPYYSTRQLDAIKNFEKQLSELHPKFKETPEAINLLKQSRNQYPIEQADIENALVRNIVDKTNNFVLQIVGYGRNMKGSSIQYGKYIGRIKSGKNVYYTTSETISFRYGNNQIQFIKGLSNQGREFVGKVTLYGRSGLQYGKGYYRDPIQVFDSIERLIQNNRFITIQEPQIFLPSTIVNQMRQFGLTVGIGISTGITTNIATQTVQSTKSITSLALQTVQAIKQAFGRVRQELPIQREIETQVSTQQGSRENTTNQEETSTNQDTGTIQQQITQQTITSPEPPPQEPQKQTPPPTPLPPPITSTIPSLPIPMLGMVGSFAGQSRALQKNVNNLVNEIVYSVRRLF